MIDIQEAIKEIEELARSAPGGLPDPLAYEKYLEESREFYEAIRDKDYIEAALELADRVYYLVKAKASGVINDKDFIKRVEVACMDLGVSTAIGYELCFVKYRYRIGRYVKGWAANRAGERQEIKAVFDS